ncbi:acid phosphatase [Ancylobacter sp. MQZ15Z-1]|uniref:Acid phosphatase n=1 Tax=Ancylobacter mangrovi TaxID=2972472 RepID=A0A9X2T251_9HYPH|nr:HAD family acid phosphatase [Ancylobacter mangrovi]MCS0495830.1 acid phosphatase [Ancylobacter mangrovi]
MPGGASAEPALHQPANVGDAKNAATRYHDDGGYGRDIDAVTKAAGRWIARRAGEVARPAMVFDIDDTALSNWQVIEDDDYGRIIGGPCPALPERACGWAAWDLRAGTPAIVQTLALYREAKRLGIAVFFITGRGESQRGATVRNLAATGFGGYDGLAMVPRGAHFASAADFKAPQRAAIEAKGFRIIANIGDQPSDLAGGHAERRFLLPNPFYRIP